MKIPLRGDGTLLTGLSVKRVLSPRRGFLQAIVFLYADRLSFYYQITSVGKREHFRHIVEIIDSRDVRAGFFEIG